MGPGETWSSVLLEGKGREGNGEYDTFFITSLSLGSDMTGCFGIAGPGFLVNALRWV